MHDRSSIRPSPTPQRSLSGRPGTSPVRAPIVVVAPAELDPCTAPAFEARLLAVPTHCDLVIDMAGVMFCDSAGIEAIIGAVDHRSDTARTTTIQDPSQSARLLIELCGLDTLVAIEWTQDAARGRPDGAAADRDPERRLLPTAHRLPRSGGVAPRVRRASFYWPAHEPRPYRHA